MHVCMLTEYDYELKQGVYIVVVRTTQDNNIMAFTIAKKM